MEGTYLYQHYNFSTGKTEVIRIPVDVLKETDKSYRVKLKAPNVNGHKWGDEIWVQKKNIVLPQTEPKYDYSDAWWNN